MTKRLLFLYDSTGQPFEDINIQTIRSYLTELQAEDIKCKMVDTKDMPEENLKDWRKEATLTAVWRGQQIRQTVGSRKQGGLPYIGKQVPALLVYEEGERLPVAIYPHSKKKGEGYIDHPIEGFLEELMALR